MLHASIKEAKVHWDWIREWMAMIIIDNFYY